MDKKKKWDKRLVFLVGSIDGIIEDLTKLKSEGYTKVDSERDYYDSVDFYAYKEREETDDEYLKRMKEEKRLKESRREYYEKLKKEFGDK